MALHVLGANPFPESVLTETLFICFVQEKRWQFTKQLRWNLSVTTTSIIKSITFDLFSNVF